MKKILYYVAFTIATLSLSSCSDENEVVSENLNYPSDGKTLIANIVDPVSGDVTSRTNISSSFNFTWVDGDVLGIFPDEGDQIYFKITKGAGTNTATFDGGGWALKKGHSYYSYYPFNRENFSSEETKKTIPVSIEGQSIDGDNMFGHLGKYDPMFAQSKNTTGSIAWDFQHLVSWLKLKVTLPVNCSISKIVLSNTDGLLHTTGTVDLTSSLPTIAPTNSLNEISIPCENVSVKANEETVIPVVIIPTNLSEKTISIKLFTDFIDYSFNLSITKEWKQGYFYSQEIIDNNIIPTYEVTTPGTLSSLVGESNKYRIKSMKVSGNLNGTDIKFIREMAGHSDYLNTTDGNLRDLDLSNVNIVEGGNPYYKDYNSSLNTENNKIGANMFYRCTLNSIVLPLNVTSIGHSAFRDCYSLSGISIPNTVTNIGIHAFSSCYSLTRISIPNSVTIIKSYAFDYCYNLNNITLSENLETIEQDNFSGSKIKNIVIPNSVTKIGARVFENNDELESVIISENITEIDQEFCSGCLSLKEVTCLAKTPPTLGWWSFKASSPTPKPDEKIDVLYVPKGCITAYSESDWNNYFFQIKEIGE